MAGLRTSALFLLLLVTVVVSEKKRYDNYKVYRVVPQTQREVTILRALENGRNDVSFWKEVTHPGRPVDIMVSPDKVSAFDGFLKRMHLQADVYIENVQSLIDNENPKYKESKKVDWTVYNRYDEIVSWLEDTAQQNPNIASTFSVGTSYEGRDIRGLKLSTGGSNKPAIYIDGAHHAREWITSATTTWIINELLTSTDSEVQGLLQDFDWYFQPVVNTDGYEYTHTDERLWRKTRSVNENSALGCIGTDPNRNYDYQWRTGGSSSEPCSDTYAGANAFSEQEALAVANYLQSISEQLVFYLSLHSYGQYVLFPYGNNLTHYEFYDEYMRVGNIAADAIAQRYGTEYTVGTVVDVLYVTSGISIDWVKGVLDTQLAYSYELRDEGRYGFVLPAEQIIPTAEETFDGIVAVARDLKTKLQK